MNCNPTYTACDGSIHSTQAAANAVSCSHTETIQILNDLSCVEYGEAGDQSTCLDLIGP